MKFGLLSIIVLFSLSAADDNNYDDDAGWKVDGRNQSQLKSAQLPFKLWGGCQPQWVFITKTKATQTQVLNRQTQTHSGWWGNTWLSQRLYFSRIRTRWESDLSLCPISIHALQREPIQQRPLRQYEAQTLRGSRIVFLSFLHLLLLTASTGRNAFFNLSGIRGGSLGFYGTHTDFCISSPARPWWDWWVCPVLVPNLDPTWMFTCSVNPPRPRLVHTSPPTLRLSLWIQSPAKPVLVIIVFFQH